MSGRDIPLSQVPLDPRLDALAGLWHTAHGDRPEAGSAARFLLGMYEPARFTFTLADLAKMVDGRQFEACLSVLALLRGTTEPIQVLLHRRLGLRNMGARLEILACDWHAENRCSPGCEALIRSGLERDAQLMAAQAELRATP